MLEVFGYFLLGLAIFHSLCHANQKNISRNFYAYLEYFYIAAAVVSLLSISNPLSKIQKESIAFLENKLQEITEAEKDGSCDGVRGNWITFCDVLSKKI